jgi:hypothetical protein
MLASITPLGERGRNRKWSVTVAFYLVGSVLGGTLLGTGAGIVGSFLRSAVRPSGALTLLVIGASALAALVIDSRRAAVPSLRRQVNEDWLRQYRSWVYGVGFGVQLGAGLATIVTSAATYLLVVVALLSPSLWLAVALGTLYGSARALPVLLTARVTNFAQLGDLHRRLSSLRPRARRLALLTELAVAVAATGGAVAVR